LHVPVGEVPAEEVVDVVGMLEVVVVVGGVVTGAEVVVVVGAEPGEVVVVVTVVEVGDEGAVPRDGVAEQVLTWRPAVSDTRPSGPRGSEGPAGRLPTYALKL
jgi:hypothetical protein